MYAQVGDVDGICATLRARATGRAPRIHLGCLQPGGEPGSLTPILPLIGRVPRVDATARVRCPSWSRTSLIRGDWSSAAAAVRPASSCKGSTRNRADRRPRSSRTSRATTASRRGVFSLPPRRPMGMADTSSPPERRSRALTPLHRQFCFGLAVPLARRALRLLTPRAGRAANAELAGDACAECDARKDGARPAAGHHHVREATRAAERSWWESIRSTIRGVPLCVGSSSSFR